jgi:hypothetical protein
MAETAIQSQLLEIAKDICFTAPISCMNAGATTIGWANLTELDPGLGLEADLSGSVTNKSSVITRADFWLLQPGGESYIVVRPSLDAKLYEDPFSKYILDAFRQYDHSRRLSLNGLARIARIRQPELIQLSGHNVA